MIEKDTIRLLRECDAGTKMGIESITQVIDHVENHTFKDTLSKCRNEHKLLENEINGQLDRFMDEGKEPNPMARSMSWLKTNMKLAMDDSDKTVACLMTDGCNMGVKSLHRYLNQYHQADSDSKGIATRLIQLEDDLAKQMRQYL